MVLFFFLILSQIFFSTSVTVFTYKSSLMVNPFTPKIKMQILQTIHVQNVWVMLWELIATSAIVWAKYQMPCSPLCTSYLWVEFEGRTFTLTGTFRSEGLIPVACILFSDPLLINLSLICFCIVTNKVVIVIVKYQQRVHFEIVQRYTVY